MGLSERDITSNVSEQTADDLSAPHEQFPPLTRATLYDLVTRMYLDCGDDGEVAVALSGQYGSDVTSDHVHSFRREAAVWADRDESPDIRRKWIYRYQTLTVNNLVKEYMFMEGKLDFLSAKRELAEEIDSLTLNTPANRLWIAVNDALGRNNIGTDLIRALQAYLEAARRIEGYVRPYAQKHELSVNDAMLRVAAELRSFTLKDRAGKKGSGKADHVERELDLAEGTLTAEDEEFLREFKRFSTAPTESKHNLMYRIMHGADVLRKPIAGPLEKIIRGKTQGIDADDIEEAFHGMRAHAVLDSEQLTTLRDCAIRHIEQHNLRKEINAATDVPADATIRAQEAWESLEDVANDHLDIRDLHRFYTLKEVAKAERLGITESDLQNVLDTLNSLGSFELTTHRLERAEDIWPHRRIEFPAERYCRKRFGVGLQATR